MKSEEDIEELMHQLIGQIQSKLKNELNLREIFIPNSKAEARCNIFVSSNYATCNKLCIFLQPGPGMLSFRSLLLHQSARLSRPAVV